MLRFFRFCCLVVILTLTAPAWAQSTVEWSIGLQGDVLNIDAKTAAAAPAQRLNSSPAFLELAFPKSKMTGAALTKAVDKGLVQKIQTLQEGDKVLVRVFILNKPKASLTKTADGYRYAIRMSEPAGSASAGSAPKPPKPPVASSPSSVASQPRVVTPPATEPPALTPPATQPRVVPPPATTTSSDARNPKTPITVLFENRPLADAIREMAAKAGYTATVDPKISGVVNLSISEMPFEDALAQLLEPYGDAIASDIGYTTVTVSKTSSSSSATSQPGSSQPTSSQPTATANPNGPIVSEYYPFSTKDAQKMMDAARKAIPELSYRVDPVLNILLVQGPREDVVRLGELLKSMSNK